MCLISQITYRIASSRCRQKPSSFSHLLISQEDLNSEKRQYEKSNFDGFAFCNARDINTDQIMECCSVVNIAGRFDCIPSETDSDNAFLSFLDSTDFNKHSGISIL